NDPSTTMPEEKESLFGTEAHSGGFSARPPMQEVLAIRH
ncbi:MAG: hypothetical protein AVDCRST_MAG89-3659, partial [uncultured Gemmatimonadetes bacterium]